MKDMLIWYSWNSVAGSLDTGKKWVADNIDNDDILVAYVINIGDEFWVWPGFKWALFSLVSLHYHLCLLADCCMHGILWSINERVKKKHPEWVGGGVLVGMFAFEIAMFFPRINLWKKWKQNYNKIVQMFPQKGHTLHTYVIRRQLMAIAKWQDSGR